LKKSQIIILALSLSLYSLTIVFNKLLIKDPNYNLFILSLPILMPEIRKTFSKIGALALSFILFSATLLLALPFFDVISPMVFIVTFFLFIILYFYSDFFTFYIKKAGQKEIVLQQKMHDLKIMKDELANLEKINLDMEKEIKEITSLYSAVKEMGSKSLTMADSIINIMEIIKKIVKYNFKINLEDLSFFIMVKNGTNFPIQQSYGYDEKYLKNNEKRIAEAILKKISDRSDIIYNNKIGENERNQNEVVFNKSMLYIPLHAENKLVGVLFFSSNIENVFNEKQIESMKILANPIAILMEKVFLYEEITMISKIDSLTGLYVHREFQERLENELKRCARYQKELALIIGDIDFFKKMNDYYGHLAGDYVLKTIALILKNNTDAVDSVARYGGEEFVIILPDSDKKKAFQKAETIRKSIENYEFTYKGTKMGVTMSFGVAAYPGDATTRRAIIDKADKALYKAKETGRNKVMRSE